MFFVWGQILAIFCMKGLNFEFFYQILAILVRGGHNYGHFLYGGKILAIFVWGGQNRKKYVWRSQKCIFVYMGILKMQFFCAWGSQNSNFVVYGLFFKMPFFIYGVSKIPFCCIWGSRKCQFLVYGVSKNIIFVCVGLENMQNFTPLPIFKCISPFTHPLFTWNANFAFQILLSRLPVVVFVVCCCDRLAYFYGLS